MPRDQCFDWFPFPEPAADLAAEYHCGAKYRVAKGLMDCKALFLALLGVVLILAGCRQRVAERVSTAPTLRAAPVKQPAMNLACPQPLNDAPVDYPGLQNVVAFGDGLYSGSAPDGDLGFETLKALGVATIISVDGARPDVEAARVLGLRYVHLPIGYNGMDERRTLEIARAVHDLPGPVYLHCHHGKHRSAGAAGAAAVTLGKLSRAQALERMRVSGTAPSYTGLFQCVSNARPATDLQLSAADNHFPEVWHTSGLVQTMVEIDETFDRLRLIEKSAWKTPANHADLVPAAEAGRLTDLFRNLHDDSGVQSRPIEFRDWLDAASASATALESGLLAQHIQLDRLSRHFSEVTASCKHCHTKYRD